MTRWNPSVSSCVSSAATFGCSFSVVACAILASSSQSVQEIPILFDMRGKIERVLPRQRLGALGIAPLQRLDDLHVIDDRALRAIVLADRRLANRAHMNEQVLGHVGEELITRQPDDRLMELDVGFRILVEMSLGRAILELVEEAAQPGDFFVRGMLRDQASRETLERRPDTDHVDDLLLRFTHDKNAAARRGTHEALALKDGHRLANGRA